MARLLTAIACTIRQPAFSAIAAVALMLPVFSTPALARERIMKLPLPDFATVRQGVDESLNKIIHRALARDPANRYPTADEFMKALEYQIYGKGYGPTNETIGKFMRELFDVDAAPAPEPAAATA